MSAFACEPNSGSEPAVGWHWAEEASRLHDVWVITHTSHRQAIEQHLNHVPNDHLKFVFVDTPARVHATGLSGLLLRIQYVAWQARALRVAKRLHRDLLFDIGHHVTYCSYRYPTFLTWMGIPFIWGPLGGGERTPTALSRAYPPSDRLLEGLRGLSNLVSKFDPITRLTARRAMRLIAVNPDTAAALPRVARSKTIVETASSLDGAIPKAQEHSATKGRISLIFAGKLIPSKGVHLLLPAIRRALDRQVEVHLDIVGSGPMQSELQDTIHSLHLEEQVSLVGQLPMDQLMERYTVKDAFIFPSFRDSGGTVVLEAMAAGIPVICLDLGGPAYIVTNDTGIRIPANDVEQVIDNLSDAIVSLANDPQRRHSMGAAGRDRIEQSFTWNRKREFIHQLYASVSSHSGDF